MTRTLERPTHPHPAAADDARWAAVVARDKAFEGQFFYSVATTGVYCRPGCPARLPKRANVRFYETQAAAEAAGFRPCKRCKPDAPSLAEQQAAKVAEACRLIEAAEEPLSLDALAARLDVSPYHFHRMFKSVLGVTPKAYAIAHRQQRMRATLERSDTVTEAIYAAGFNSSGPFYASAPQALGMTPSEFRSGGENTEIRFTVGRCSLGAILVAASAKGVCAIMLGDDPDALLADLQGRFSRARLIGGDPAFEELTAKVIGFVEAPSSRWELPLDIRGTAFQHRVWEALRDIPPGTTASYTEIAERIGRPEAVRAVAQACGANPVAVAIPCHRVVRSDGALSGYRWGMERKRKLLAREKKF
jgi:AraC family transcriptional regulator of adaptative response/methylated-DNA-[protein]-cysteine methyltransferase